MKILHYSLLFTVLNLGAAMLPSCSGPQTIPLPPGGPEALPAEVLLRAGHGVEVTDRLEVFALEEAREFYTLSEEIGERLWPGWPWRVMVFGFCTAPERWLLVNHDDAPPGMEVANQEILPVSVYVGPRPLEIVDEGCLSYRGNLLAVLQVEEWGRAEREQAGRVPLLIRLFRDAFLLFRGVETPSLGRPEDFSSNGVYPLSLDPLNNMLGRAEALALAEALATEDLDDAFESAACFLALRRFRRSGSDPRLTAVEQQWETRIGLACYTGFKAIDLACAAERDDATHIDYKILHGFMKARRKAMLDLVGRSGFFLGNSGFISLGMAQAFLLDRLAPGWKTMFLQGRARSMESLLETFLEGRGMDG